MGGVDSLLFLYGVLCYFSYIVCLTSTILLFQVLIGGGRNHRLGLFDMVMIKDNHISIAGGVTSALKSVDQYLESNNVQMGVEVIFIIKCVKLHYLIPLAIED